MYRSALRLSLAAIAVPLVLGLAACGDDHPAAGAEPTGSVHRPASSSPSVAPTSRTEPTQAEAATTKSSLVRPTRMYDASKIGAAFVSPSGNVVCVMYGPQDMSPHTVRCDISERSYPDPPRPPECPSEFGNSFLLAETASLRCVGDTIRSQAYVGNGGYRQEWWDGHDNPSVDWDGMPLVGLGYGNAIKVGELTCASAESGVSCTNTRTGHGFTVAKARYTLK